MSERRPDVDEAVAPADVEESAGMVEVWDPTGTHQGDDTLNPQGDIEGDDNLEGEGVWATLSEAAEQADVSVSTLRAWYRQSKIRSRMVAGPHGQQREVVLADVMERAEQAKATRRSQQAAEAAPERSPQVEAPPDTVLLPIDAWERVLAQLGNLHEAGQQMAEARERAAKAETKAEFLAQRLREREEELKRLQAPDPDPKDQDTEHAAQEPTPPRRSRWARFWGMS